MKTLMKKTLSLIVCTILLVSIISAQEISIKSNKEGFNFVNWLKNLFKGQEFTIVGQDRQCDVYAKKTLDFAQYSSMNVKASSYCSPGYGLIDIFDQKWNEIAELKDSINFICGDPDGCRVEVYCCPHPECGSDSECVSWVGTGSKCNMKTAIDPYMPLMDSNLNILSNYKYCTSSCTGNSITCWRIEGTNICTSRTYDCSYETYPNCPTSYPYTSRSNCESYLPPPIPNCDSCASLGYSCGNVVNNCGINLICGECPSGYTCNNHQCTLIPCETMSGTSGRCDSNTITDKKCDGTKVYVCSDYGASGKCWTNMADCSLSGKTCSNGECQTNGGGGTQCSSGADINNDNIVSRNELGTVINNWIAGTITRDALGLAIQEWTGGC